MTLKSFKNAGHEHLILDTYILMRLLICKSLEIVEY